MEVISTLTFTRIKDATDRSGLKIHGDAIRMEMSNSDHSVEIQFSEAAIMSNIQDTLMDVLSGKRDQSSISEIKGL